MGRRRAHVRAFAGTGRQQGPGVRPEAVQYLPCGHHPGRAAQQRDVHVRPQSVPPDHRDVPPDLPPVQGQDAHFLRRRCGVFQLRQAVRCRYLAHYRGHYHPQTRRLQPPAADGGEGGAYGLSTLRRHRHRGHLRNVRRQPHRCASRQAHQAAAQPQERQGRALDRLLLRTLQGRLPHRTGYSGVH